jgi:hypothetical protein
MAKKAYRIPWSQVESEELFLKNLEFVKENLDIIDEIAIFCVCSPHGYMPLSELERQRGILKERIPRYREAGVKSVGLNILVTVGHIDEDWEVMEKSSMQTLVGIDGAVSHSCLCVGTDEFKEYIAQKYRLLASVGADFIWADDDIRHWNHGAARVHCFCPGCIAKFNEVCGENQTFESLTSALLACTHRDSELWKKWSGFVFKEYEELCGIIGKAARDTDPKVKMGFMCGIYAAIPERILALGAVKARPGGGFYNDENPAEMLTKNLSVAAQAAYFPETVTDIQYEHENFPFVPLKKSKKFINSECVAALMCGCNGIAFSVMPAESLPHPKITVAIRENFPLWDKIAELSEGSAMEGAFVSDYTVFSHFASIGVPVCPDFNKPSVKILTQENSPPYQSLNLSDGDLKKILSGGVLLDHEAFEYVSGRGMAELCGVKRTKLYESGVAERFTDDPLNAGYAGFFRSAEPASYKTQRHIGVLEPTAPGCRTLCGLETLRGEKAGACMTVYENALGGRVAVSTYLYPDRMYSVEKREQILNVLDWLGGGLPVRIEKAVKIAPFVRRKKDGGVLIALYNADFDESGAFAVKIRGFGQKPFYAVGADGNIPLKTEPAGDGVRVFAENIAPFEFLIITN